MNQAVFGVLAAVMSFTAAAQQSPPPTRATRMQITVERREGKLWKAVDPALVFSSGDAIRFRFKTGFEGYLYVTNYGTSGKYTLLFPRQETGQKNRVQAAREYLIPATDSIFRISGEPGYESVYWLVSPLALGSPDMTPPQPSQERLPTLLPRCDETVLRARGLCLDSAAGPRRVGDGDKLPDNLEPMRSAVSRDITILRQDKQSVLSTEGSASAPLLYEFRLAHK